VCQYGRTQEAAISALGAIAATPTGISVLANQPVLLAAFLSYLASANDELKVATLHSLAHILGYASNVMLGQTVFRSAASRAVVLRHVLAQSPSPYKSLV
jgi:hypothetical protein